MARRLTRDQAPRSHEAICEKHYIRDRVRGLCVNGRTERSFASAIEGCPVAGLDEVRPVEGMETGIARQHAELHETQRFAATFSELEILVVAPHLPLGPCVAHGPQAHEQRLGAGEHERASQTVHAVAVSHFPYTGIAS